MPPANSRYPSPPSERQSPSRAQTQTPPSYLSQALSDALESPHDVYNLAATLTTRHADTQAAQHDDAAHFDSQLRSLRANLDEHTAALSQIGVHLGHRDPSLDRHQRRLERSRDRLRSLVERDRTDLEHRDRTDRLRRVMNRLGRLGAGNVVNVSGAPTADTGTSAYGDRVPSRNSLYDWSPATEEADDEAELEGILAELRREQPNTHPEILRVLGRSQLDSERERSRAAVSRLLSSTQPSQAESSLRSAALLQSARRFSARTRDSTQRYTDRDAARSSHGSDWRDRSYTSSESTRAAMDRLSQRRETARDRDMLQRVDSYRRSYLERTANASSSVSPMVEQTIKYLAKIRQSQSIDESLNHAIDAGFLGKDYFVDDHQDFVLDSFMIPPPADTSWLAPGAVLSGCQHATTVTSTVTTSLGPQYRFTHPSNRPTNPNIVNIRATWDTPTNRPSSTESTTQPSLPEIVTSHSPQQDRWPVKVTIHSVDYTLMTLSATMEAYNVPSHPHSHQSFLSSSSPLPSFTRTSSITTYLEGEILDFNTHTLLTESFNSSPATDATYWRKLPVFHGMSDDDVVRCLTSRAWFEDVLLKEWVLMRWKERCFVKSLGKSSLASTFVSSSPSSFPAAAEAQGTEGGGGGGEDGGRVETEAFGEEGCGLTISGFYYVCLRRRDGRVEGLYFDPQSSPYQCLELESTRGGSFPKWGFR